MPVVTAAARRYALFILALVYMFNFIDRQILAILLPAIRAEFQVSDTVLGLLSGTAFALFYVTLGVPIARLADRVNRRNLIAAAIALWSGMTALSGFAANIWHLTLARIGVGVGEAGCSPPAHSMIADYYPPEQRSAAMGVYTLGISAGVMLAYLAGGWVVQNVGWREAFFLVGVPGLALALVVRFTLTEPERGASEQRVDSGSQPTLREVFGFLRQRPAFVNMAIAAGLTSFSGYAVISWLPSFVERSFNMPIAQIGLWLGLIYGFCGGFGFYAGGWLADRIGRRGHRQALLFISVSLLVTAALSAAVFLAPSVAWCLAIYTVPAVISNFYLAPVFSQTQNLVSLRMRALASALMLLILNSIGLAMGAPVAGALSDWLEPGFAAESMRYSLLLVSLTVLPLAAWFFYRASRSIEADLARAGELD